MIGDCLSRCVMPATVLFIAMAFGRAWAGSGGHDASEGFPGLHIEGQTKHATAPMIGFAPFGGQPADKDALYFIEANVTGPYGRTSFYGNSGITWTNRFDLPEVNPTMQVIYLAPEPGVPWQAPEGSYEGVGDHAYVMPTQFNWKWTVSDEDIKDYYEGNGWVYDSGGLFDYFLSWDEYDYPPWGLGSLSTFGTFEDLGTIVPSGLLNSSGQPIGFERKHRPTTQEIIDNFRNWWGDISVLNRNTSDEVDSFTVKEWDHSNTYYLETTIENHQRIYLSKPDEEKDARARGVTTQLASNDLRRGHTYRQKRTDRNREQYWSVEEYDFGYCSEGQYEIRLTLKATPDSGPITYPEGSFTRYFSDKDAVNGKIRVKVPVMPGLTDGWSPDDEDWIDKVPPGIDYVIHHLEAVPVSGACAEGGCEGSTPGAARIENGCVDAVFHLGSGEDGKSYSMLKLYSEDLGAVAADPDFIRIVTGGDDPATAVRIMADLHGVKTTRPQIRNQQVSVNLVPDGDGRGYSLYFYHTSDGDPDEDYPELLDFGTTEPFQTYAIRLLPDSGANRYLRITKGAGSSQQVYLYTQNTQSTTDLEDDDWTLSECDGMRVTAKTSTAVGGVSNDRYVTTTLSDSVYGDAEVTRERLHSYAWGEEVVEVVSGFGLPTALVTTHAYYESGPGISRLQSTAQPNGTTIAYTYTAGDQSPVQTTTTYPGGRVITVIRESLADQSADSDSASEVLETTTETLNGVFIGRTWSLVYSGDTSFDGVAWSESRSIQASSPSAAWSDSGNRISITRKRDTTAGSVTLSHSADGTLQRSLHGLPNTFGEVTIGTESGEPGSTGTTVVAGTRTEETRDVRNRMISRKTYDIVSTRLIADQTVLSFQDDVRPWPTLIEYLDGSTESRIYSECCGRLTNTTRHGLTTVYAYDDLGRTRAITEGGITHANNFDAAGRVRRVRRYPADTVPALIDSIAVTVSTSTYDTAGRLTATTDGAGRVTSYAEVVSGSTGLKTIMTTLPFDPAWPLVDRGTKIEVRLADGRMKSLTGTAASPVRYEYGTLTLPDASQWGISGPVPYTREIKLTSTGEDSAETITNYADFFGRHIKTLYADGGAARSFYNGKGQLVRQTDPDSVQMLYTYNGVGEREFTALDYNRNGSIEQGGTDRITRSTVSYTVRDATPIRRTTTEVWEVDGSASATTVSLSDVSLDGLKTWQSIYGEVTHTSIAYNESLGERTEITVHPDLTRTTRLYRANRLMKETRGDSSENAIAETRYGYDAHGLLRVTSSLQAPGSDLPEPDSPLVTTYTYYTDGQIATVRTPDSDTSRSGGGYDQQLTAYHYDAAGRVDDVTQSDGTHVYTSYWPSGQVKRTWGSRVYPSEYTYDAQGRVKTLTTWKDFATTAGAAVTTWNYHSHRGWLQSKTYDGSTAGPSYTYWPSGRLKTRTWARGFVRNYNYNNAGDLSSATYALSTGVPSVDTYYDRVGRLIRTTGAAGTHTWTYDRGQLDDESYAGGPLSGLTLTRTLKSNSGSATVARPGTLTATGISALTYDYNDAGRLHSITEASGPVAVMDYKPYVGALQDVTVSSGGVARLAMTREIDELGRVGVVEFNNPSSGLLASRVYTYNAANQRMLVEHEDTRRWAYGYDDLGQVNLAEKRLSNSSVLPGHAFAFEFDTIGNRKTATANGRSSNYLSDSLNRYQARGTPLWTDVRGEALSQVVSGVEQVKVLVNDELALRTGADFYSSVPVFGMTENPLRIQAARATPEQVATEDRSVLVPAVPESFVYDLDGNLTQDGLWNYEWDIENRLKAQELRSEVSATIWTRLEYAYDAQGRRIQKVVKSRATAEGSWTTVSDTRCLYDGWNLVAEYAFASGTFTLLRSHTWGLDLSGSHQGAGGVGGLLWTKVASASKTYAAGSDANGNIVLYVDCADGSVAGKRDYGAFGETVKTTGVASDLPFAFSSKYEEKESGLYYYGLRYYNPSTGRWLSRDPIGERGGRNLYGMIGNNLVNDADYLGLVSMAEQIGYNLIIDAWNRRDSGALHGLMIAAAAWNQSSRPTTAEWLMHYLNAKNRGAGGGYKWFNEAQTKAYFGDKNIYADIIAKLEALAKQLRRGEIQQGIQSGSFSQETRPANADMLTTVGRAIIYYKIDFTCPTIENGKIYEVLSKSVWWIDDKYDFNAPTFNHPAGEIPTAAIFTFLEENGLASSFNTRAVVYGEHKDEWGKTTGGLFTTHREGWPKADITP